MKKFHSALQAGLGFLTRHCSLSIILVNALINIINAVVFYHLIPLLLNYPPHFMEYSRKYSIDYRLQFIILLSFLLLSVSIVIKLTVGDVDEWERVLSGDAEDKHEKIAVIRRKCMNLPYRIYLYQIILPVLILIVYCTIYTVLFEYTLLSFISIIIIVFAFFSLTSVIIFLFSKRIFTEVLYRTNLFSNPEGVRVNLKSKIILQVLPMFIASILFTSLLGYSRFLEERGDDLFRGYKSQLIESFNGMDAIDGQADIIEKLDQIDVEGTKTLYFIIQPDGRLITSDGSKLNRLFTQHLRDNSYRFDGRVYDETGQSSGAMLRIQSSSGSWTVGIKYNVASRTVVLYLFGNFIILTLIVFFLLYLFSRTITSDISTIAASLSQIASGWEMHSRQRIPITSNDEIGDLIEAFNRVMDCELEYDRLKTEFIANISHEFRTPLNIILNTLQLVNRYISISNLSKDEPRLDRHLLIMRQNCYRLLKLINNLIDSTKMEANFFRLYLQNCDIVWYVRQITISVSEYIKDKSLSLAFHSDTGKKIITFDPDAIERVLLNLLSNAVKFNKKGGSIDVGIYDRNDTVLITIRDTGVGIPEDKLSSIFNRFIQIDRTLTKSHEGSGIGLSIVKSLVEMHNGTISVSSQYGKGTEFTITLPAVVSSEQFKVDIPKNCFESKLQQGIEKIEIEFSDI